MARSQRDKGARGEREAAAAIGINWFAADCRRAAANGVHEAPDIQHALPSASIEVKRRARLAVYQFVDQAKAQAMAGEIPVVVMRQDRGEWLVLLRLTDSLGFAQRLATNMGQAIGPIGWS